MIIRDNSQSVLCHLELILLSKIVTIHTKHDSGCQGTCHLTCSHAMHNKCKDKLMYEMCDA